MGFSLRQTAVVAKAAGWLEMSDVALLKKLRQSEKWLQALCVGLLRDSELTLPTCRGLRMRLIDGTLVKEPGQGGSQWRVHYSLRVPEWTCDYFHLSPAEGNNTAESLRHFPINPSDCLIADRGYSHAAGIHHVHQHRGHFIVRHHAQGLIVHDEKGTRFDLLEWLRELDQPGQCASRLVTVPGEGPAVAARLCAVRKSQEAILATQRRLRRRAQKNCAQLREQTLEYAQWVLVLTNVPSDLLSLEEVLEWYRIRWQVELAFKRLKSLADLGHLPKHDPSSSRAWLYGKLLIALLTEKMQRYAKALSPWGMRWLEQESPAQPLEGE
jgi:hypothetical protein